MCNYSHPTSLFTQRKLTAIKCSCMCYTTANAIGTFLLYKKRIYRRNTKLYCSVYWSCRSAKWKRRFHYTSRRLINCTRRVCLVFANGLSRDCLKIALDPKEERGLHSHWATPAGFFFTDVPKIPSPPGPPTKGIPPIPRRCTKNRLSYLF